MKAFCTVAVLTCGAKATADGDCVGDLMTVGKDVAGAGMAIKDIAVHCHGSDRGPCQDAVDKLLTQISTAVTDIGPCTTSCGSHSPECVDEIKTLGDKINAIDEPAKKMADECAGAHKSTIACVFDGIKIGADVAAVAGEIAKVVVVCKKTDDINDACGAGWPCPPGCQCDGTGGQWPCPPGCAHNPKQDITVQVKDACGAGWPCPPGCQCDGTGGQWPCPPGCAHNPKQDTELAEDEDEEDEAEEEETSGDSNVGKGGKGKGGKGTTTPPSGRDDDEDITAQVNDACGAGWPCPPGCQCDGTGGQWPCPPGCAHNPKHDIAVQVKDACGAGWPCPPGCQCDGTGGQWPCPPGCAHNPKQDIVV